MNPVTPRYRDNPVIPQPEPRVPRTEPHPAAQRVAGGTSPAHGGPLLLRARGATGRHRHNAASMGLDRLHGRLRQRSAPRPHGPSDTADLDRSSPDGGARLLRPRASPPAFRAPLATAGVVPMRRASAKTRLLRRRPPPCSRAGLLPATGSALTAALATFACAPASPRARHLRRRSLLLLSRLPRHGLTAVASPRAALTNPAYSVCSKTW